MHGLRGDLGEAIRELCRRERPHWHQLPGYVERALLGVDDAARGVVHRDFSPQNTGWRQERSTLLLFDVPQMAIGPLANLTRTVSEMHP